MKIRVLSLAALVGLAVPLAASAQSRGYRSSPSAGLGAGVLLGMESGDGVTGLALRGDGVWDVKPLAPKVLLSGVLSVGFTHFSDAYWNGPDQQWAWSDNIFKIVPAARFTFDVAPQLGLYADAGLGLYIASTSTTLRNYYAGYSTVQSSSDSTAGVAMRFAGGTFFNVSSGVRLGAELGLNPYFGDYHDTTFSLMGLAQFRL